MPSRGAMAVGFACTVITFLVVLLFVPAPKAHTTVTNIPIVKRLDPICSVGSRVAVQDASETKAGVEGRVTLYKCVQEKPRWEPE